MIIHTSSNEAIAEADFFDGTIPDFIRTSPYTDDTTPFFIDAASGDQLSQRELWKLSKEFLTIFRQHGLGQNRDNSSDPSLGDVFITLFPNCIWAGPIHWAALDAGATISPASVAYTVTEFAHQLQLVEPKMVVYLEAFEDLLTDAIAVSKTNPVTISLEQLLEDSLRVPLAQANYQFANRFQMRPKESISRVAYLAMSSGTSGGLFKAVRITHGNITSNALMSTKSSRSLVKTNQVSSAIIPVSHLYGLAQFLVFGVYRGTAAVFHQGFDFVEFLDAAVKYKVNIFPLVPPIIILLAKHPLTEKYVPELKKNLTHVLSGAAPLGVKATEEFLERITGRKDGKSEYGNLRVIQGWGMTETSPVCTLFDPEDPVAHIRSVGKLVSNTEARVVYEGVDQPACDVDPAALTDVITADGLPTGEIYIRGPHVADGYHKNPTANAEAYEEASDWTPDMPWYKRRWLRTGDVGFFDLQGRVMIVDRSKELIKSMGKQVAPAELEDALLANPLVADCAVIGVMDHDRGTESPRAFVVLREAGSDAVSILKTLNKQMPKYKNLHGGIVVIDEVPRNPSGKVLRRLLRGRTGDVVLGLDVAKL
ncbi:putative 4-coumarate--CoA ligase-like 8 [Yarrowia sp. C11]|nr:putative 4-coumarate--CoA ligase-like 8 [Yarrowia sp. C11]KAG5364795.1 putative 4-coumarate--CoA ligase-like 8 [Yarrowia sp. E02]